MLIWIETQVRQAIRDAVNRSSRKPFAWGGLSGYEQLEAMVQGLDQIRGINDESDYLLWLRTKVEMVLAKNKTVAEDLKRAHQILLKVAQCLRYPPSAQELQFEEQVSSQWVAQEMTKLIEETRPAGRVQRSQIRLLGVLKRRWELFGQAQVLFPAKTLQDLLNQIQLVPHETYLVHRNRLADAEFPRQFFRRLHHDPFATVSA